jgi:putative ABC transport system permease protein
MSTWRLLRAWMAARPLMTLLTTLLVALGMATVVIVTLVTRQFDDRLTRDAAGIDLVVGAKGSPLQLVLAGVYHLDIPPGNIPLSAAAELRANRYVAQVLPIALGDSLQGFRIVGTEPGFLALHRAPMARGAGFDAPMQAVLGARVARETGLGPGDRFIGTHGMAAGGAAHADEAYTVSGVLAPTGGVIDRLVVTSLESIWAAHEHGPAQSGASAQHGPAAHHGPAHDHAHDDEQEAREVTMLLVRYASPLAAVSLPRAINASERLQAASPARESTRLVQLFGVGIDGLRGFGLLLLAVAALSVFVALFQALSDRRRELALMRLLGASPARLFALLLAEGLLLTALGVAVGVVLGHAAVEVAGRWLIPRGEWPLSGAVWVPIEGLYALGALAMGAVASLVPAWRAARTALTDVLAEG